MPRVIKLTWLLLLLLLPTLAQAQYAYVPIVQGNSNVTNAASITCLLSRSRTVTSGDLIIVGFSWDSGVATPTVTDTLSTTYSQALLDTSHPVRLAVYTGTASSSGADTITVAETGGGFMNVTCTEHPPVFTLTVDASASAATGNGLITSPSITTTVQNDFLYSTAGGFSSAGTFQVGTGFIMIGSTGGADSSGTEFKVTGATGSYAATFTSASNSQTAIAIVAFKAKTLGINTFSAALPDAATSTAYNYVVPATGGVSSYTWSISAGSLPTGLSINSSTGAITGTPTVSNNYSFTLQVTDGTTTTTKASTIKVTTGFNTPALVQAGHIGAAFGAFGSSVTSGDLIVMMGGYASPNAEVQSCTDTLGTVFYPIIVNQWYRSAYAGEQILAGIAPSTGADTVTCASIEYIMEFSNLQFAGSDNTSELVANSATPISSTLTTLVPNEIVISSGQVYTAAGTLTVTGTFTQIGGAGALTPTNPAYNLSATATSNTSSYTMAGNSDGHWFIGMAGFRPKSNGTVTPPVSASRHSTIL